ncbi:hypothetical protein OVA14_00920 [Agrococcus sp. SL85]|uniref:hypothetical protein n=1 Tax=Agrococcus sp. SL85 TaxID=2995141 RepID=UPI00226CF788|nr:hypothetical protein [Agrococcus sp. SL85]WAC66392.1 hypothetical protein OVA14_00920 [Agrococcus sp. SL85]
MSATLVEALRRARWWLACAAVAVALLVGTVIGWQVAYPGTLDADGRMLSGGMRRIASTGMLQALQALPWGLLVAAALLLVLRPRRAAA